jgi:hypothetical protein
MTMVFIEAAGMALIVTGFLLSQRGLLDGSARPFLALNLATASLLAVLSGASELWPLLLVQAFWALLSGRAMLLTRTEPAEQRLPIGV